MKYLRKAQAQITTAEGKTLNVNEGDGEHDLRVRFNIEKQPNINLNKGEFWIHNLSKKNRAAASFRADISGETFGGQITFSVGYLYEGGAKQIFEGDIVQAYSTREGGDWVTYIEARSAIAAIKSRKLTSVKFPKGTPVSTMALSVAAQSGVSISAGLRSQLATAYPGTILKSGQTFPEDANLAIKKLRDFLDPKKVRLHIIDSKMEGSPRGVVDITQQVAPILPDSIIGTPEIDISGVTFKTLLDPAHRAGRGVLLLSETVQSLYTEAFFATESVFHVGDNREGQFISNVRGIYSDLGKRIAT